MFVVMCLVPLQRYSCQLERLTVKIHDRYSTVSLDIRLKTYQSNGARSAPYRDWHAAPGWVGRCLSQPSFEDHSLEQKTGRLEQKDRFFGPRRPVFRTCKRPVF